MSDKLPQQIKRVAERLAGAQRVACMTGAGVSAESGVPTFRGAGGLWQGRRAEELATPEAFAHDPETVWRFYLQRRLGLAAIKPNPAHDALARFETLCPRFDLVTQNVDGLHQRAGSRNVIALHGDIWVDRCTACGYESQGDCVADQLPRCVACGAMARPGVVWFGETLPEGAMECAAECVARANVFLVVGTSGSVQPAASLAEYARLAGAFVVEINMEPTPLSLVVDEVLRGKAGVILPGVIEIMIEEAGQSSR